MGSRLKRERLDSPVFKESRAARQLEEWHDRRGLKEPRNEREREVGSLVTAIEAHD